MKFNNHYTQRASDAVRFEKKSHLPSLTIPDQSMSIQEILKRYASGQPVNAQQRNPEYHGEEDLPDLKRLDLAERQEILEAVNEEVVELTTKIKKDKTSKAEKALEKKFRENWERERQETDRQIQETKKQNATGIRGDNLLTN